MTSEDVRKIREKAQYLDRVVLPFSEGRNNYDGFDFCSKLADLSGIKTLTELTNYFDCIQGGDRE